MYLINLHMVILLFDIVCNIISNVTIKYVTIINLTVHLINLCSFYSLKCLSFNCAGMSGANTFSSISTLIDRNYGYYNTGGHIVERVSTYCYFEKIVS